MTLVTGATGFIGSHLVDRILAEGGAVRCLVRDRAKLRDLAARASMLAEADLASGSGLDRALAGVNTVIHLAGVTKTLRASDYDTGNRVATERLVAACERSRVQRFVHVSSLAAGGPSTSRAAADESMPPAPVSLYGVSKLAAERVVEASTLAFCIVRPAVVYGPRDRDVFEVFRLAARGWAALVGRGASYFSLIHVHDLADGLLAAAASQARGTYYMANAEPTTWEDFARRAGAALGRRVRAIAIPYAAAWAAGAAAELKARLTGHAAIVSRDKMREGRHRYWVCDSSRAQRDFGFAPRIALAEGIAETAHWYRQQGWL